MKASVGYAFQILATALLLAVAAGPGRAGAPTAKNRSSDGSWVSISYAELLDHGTIVRTGERLVDAVRHADRRGAVQPFVERYSFLLPYAVEMVYGPDKAPQVSLANRYPDGAQQPAWAAVLRGGRIHVTADGRGHARVFVPGDDPRAAYRARYALLRHPLSLLLPAGGDPLFVDVFAYRNDYSTSELRLHLRPFRFRAHRFPPDRAELDLEGLDRFFRQGGQLEGAELSREEGLVLYASRGPRQTLAGAPMTLADLATAYRAVFHAGDNEAFVSLDPSRDPTLATVNFGGLLEDTRVGSVVLAADKRFKTVCSGLEPDSAADVRAATRRLIPTFLTNTERAFLSRRSPLRTAWVNTRYWFYPGSCGVEADPTQHLAAVTRPRFTADAERLGEGYLAATRKKKAAALPPEVRDNIRHLNENYGRYAAAFPEIRELTGVARLMAICAWLRKARPSWLDLDGLLAVELPALETPREIPRLMTAEFLSSPASEAIDANYVRNNIRVRHLNPELQRTVEDVFGGPRGLAAFLSLRAGKSFAQAGTFAAQAEKLFEEERGKEAKDLVRSEPDLRAFLRFAASRLPGADAEDEERESDVARIRRIQTELETLRAIASLPGEAPAEPSPEEQHLTAELQEIMKKYHEGAAKRADRRLSAVIQHTGGISMEPRLFGVRKTKMSPALEKLKRAARHSGTTWEGGEWIRSRQPRRPSPAEAAPPGPPPPVSTARPLTRPAAPRPPASPAPPAEPALRTIEVRSKQGGGGLVGRVSADGKIVFSRLD